MSLQKTRVAKEGLQGRSIAFPKMGKCALFDIRKIFEIFKKIIICSLHEAKITNYELIKKGPTSNTCRPPIPHSHRSTVAAKN
jgi:hypothetical protein